MTGGIGGGPISEGVWKNPNRPANGSFGSSASMESHALALMEAQDQADRLNSALNYKPSQPGDSAKPHYTAGAMLGMLPMPAPQTNIYNSAYFRDTGAIRPGVIKPVQFPTRPYIQPYGMNVGFGSNF